MIPLLAVIVATGSTVISVSKLLGFLNRSTLFRIDARWTLTHAAALLGGVVVLFQGSFLVGLGFIVVGCLGVAAAVAQRQRDA